MALRIKELCFDLAVNFANAFEIKSDASATIGRDSESHRPREGKAHRGDSVVGTGNSNLGRHQSHEGEGQ